MYLIWFIFHAYQHARQKSLTGKRKIFPETTEFHIV